MFNRNESVVSGQLKLHSDRINISGGCGQCSSIILVVVPDTFVKLQDVTFNRHEHSVGQSQKKKTKASTWWAPESLRGDIEEMHRSDTE